MRSDIWTTLKNAIKRYNKHETDLAKIENREAKLLPNISAHILRHTFTTRLYESGSDIKIMQELLGHSTSATTLDIYTSLVNDQKHKIIGAVGNNIVMPE